MGKYIERQAKNPNDPNKFCTLFFVADDATEYPVHCGCGGINFLCELHKRQLLAGDAPLRNGLTTKTIALHTSERRPAFGRGPLRRPEYRTA